MGYVITQRRMSDNAKVDKFALFFLIFLIIVIFAVPVHAEEFGDNLTDLFQTKVFKGSWEFLTDFGWLAGFMNWIISAFCFIGLCLIILSRLTSILYLSSKPIFDRIDDIKSSGRGQNFFGFKALFADTWNAKHDSGADSIFNFVLGLAPNIKRYSDYNPDNPNPAVSEDDTVLNYILKMIGPTVIAIVLLSMGYGGQFGKMFGMITDGVMVVVDEFVNYRLDDFIDDTIHTGENYKFTLGNDKTAEGKLKEKAANGVYKSVTSKFPLSTEQKSAIGRKIEDMVRTNLDAGTVASSLPEGSKLDLSKDSAWQALKVDVVMNSNPTADNSIMTVDLKNDLGFTGSGESYIHVYISQSGNAGQDFFEPDGGQ